MQHGCRAKPLFPESWSYEFTRLLSWGLNGFLQKRKKSTSPFIKLIMTKGRESLINTKSSLFQIQFIYRKLPNVTNLDTFGISSLWGSFLSGVVTFGQQKTLNKVGSTELYLRSKNPEMRKTVLKTWYNSSFQFKSELITDMYVDSWCPARVVSGSVCYRKLFLPTSWRIAILVGWSSFQVKFETFLSSNTLMQH